MSGDEKGSIAIDIPTGNTTNPVNSIHQESCGRNVPFPLVCWVQSVLCFAREDTSRVTFAFKVGLAVLLVSLLVLIQAPYDVFGTNVIWSIITVVIMFEYTVGMTFNRGFNRALGSLFAGILAILLAEIAQLSGKIAEPYIIGVSIFIVGALTSFLKQWPSLVQYEYGFRVVVFTFCLIVVSSYRMGNPMKTAMERLYSIAMGGIIAVVVNVLIFPLWAGEQLHKELADSFKVVSDSLQECVRKYFEDFGADNSEFSKNLLDEFLEEPVYKKCKATLNSATKLESLASAAKWEPPHGRFNGFFYPWSEYVKVGAVLRYCAYEVMALHGVLHSEIQAPYNLRITFQSEITDATNQAVELVRSLGENVSSMKKSSHTALLKRVHGSTERLQHAICLRSYLLMPHIDRPPDSAIKSRPNTPLGLPLPTETQGETYHENMKRSSRRLYSWPSREVHAFEEDGQGKFGVLPRMRTVESTAALSLATFSSLLIEFIARLDHLVDAVDELSRKAEFKYEDL